MTVTIYHNPRCSKSRQALELLKDAGINPDVIEYLKTPLQPDMLERLARLLDLDARGLMRTGDKLYRELALDGPGLGREELLAALTAHPALLQRPIVVSGNRAAIGRPPEKVLEIL